MSQRFFTGHDNDINCLTLDQTRNYCATGQDANDDGVAFVCVWDTTTMCTLAKLDHPKGSRKIGAVEFSQDRNSSRMVTVQADDDHTITVWDWRSLSVLDVLKGRRGVFPQV